MRCFGARGYGLRRQGLSDTLDPGVRGGRATFGRLEAYIGLRCAYPVAGDWTPEHIKSAVKEVYRSAPSLYYLLIVGDHDDVPAEDMARTIVNQDDGNSYQYVTDYYYGCMDGEDDVLVDLYRGDCRSPRRRRR